MSRRRERTKNQTKQEMQEIAVNKEGKDWESQSYLKSVGYGVLLEFGG